MTRPEKAIPAYDQLLEATIQHLQRLKDGGTKFVSVSPEALVKLVRTCRDSSAPGGNVGAGRPSQTGRSSAQGRSEPVQPVAAKPTVAPPHVRPDPKAPPPIVLAKSSSPASSPAVARGKQSIATDFGLGLPGEPAPEKPPLSPEAKLAGFVELRQRAMACVKCSRLAAARKNVVFGVGDINAELMFVGEAPGADEDAQGEPFVGAAGQLLTKIIQTMGLSRQQVYIANILKCRPDTPGQTSGNRKPTSEEMQTCIPYLHEQIDLIGPKVLVALGGTAVEGLLGKTAGITRLRGNWQKYRGIPLMPTYHPAYLLRNQVLSEKRRVWEDMLQVMDKLGMAISDKQKKFFLK